MLSLECASEGRMKMNRVNCHGRRAVYGKIRPDWLQAEFVFDGGWRGRRYHMKQIEVYTTWEEDDWLVISVIVKYF
jgi:hypothetical protein